MGTGWEQHSNWVDFFSTCLQVTSELQTQELTCGEKNIFQLKLK